MDLMCLGAEIIAAKEVMSVCLFVCKQGYTSTTAWMSTELGGRTWAMRESIQLLDKGSEFFFF